MGVVLVVVSVVPSSWWCSPMRIDLFVVATTAGVDPRGFTPPPNARVERYLPHRPILQRAACVVCHAGMGITQKALAAGVPVCAIPFGRDQFEVARRVAVADAGVMLPKGRLDPGRLRAAVREAMTKAAGAARVQAGFATAGGAAAAADAIEDLASSRTVTSDSDPVARANRLVTPPHVPAETDKRGDPT